MKHSIRDRTAQPIFCEMENALSGILGGREAAADFLRALDSAGYAIVPHVPSEPMLDAGLRATAAWLDIPGSGLTVNREKMKRRYMSMIKWFTNG